MKLTTALLWLSLGFSGSIHAAACDADKDGDVDRLDVKMIVIARDTPASGADDSRDADGDGTITMLDARTCIRQCDLEGCGIIGPAAAPSTQGAGQPQVTPARKAAKEVSEPGTAATRQADAEMRGRAAVGSTEWKVKRGDTLYAIARAVYPGDAGKQARLRRDIVNLNPSVFADGANNMSVGVVLRLPDYVVGESTQPVVTMPVPAPPPVPDTVTPERALQPADSAPVVQPEPETPAAVVSTPTVKATPKPESAVEKVAPAQERPLATPPSSAEGNVLLSLGYSYGGDELVDLDSSYDVDAGSGAHLRLGYERFYQQGSGYRMALGLQYWRYDSSGDTTFRDTYLQVAYQYRAQPLVYGIGVVLHGGATLEEISTREYDAASGVVLYLENVGSSGLAGWGLSYTAMEIEEKNVDETFNASRAEVYYSWRF